MYISQIVIWLDSNPVSEAADVEFLTNEVLRVRELKKRMLEEQEHQQGQESSVIATTGSNGRVGGGTWRGNVPYMRIIMCNCSTGDTLF